MKHLLIVAILLTSITGFDSHAQWFDAKGRSTIVNDDKEIARNMAVQDALKHAMLFTGAQVNSIAMLSNGLLSSDRFEVKSSGSVRNLQLISENTKNNIMTVHIRADIVASKVVCNNAKTVKLIALTKFPLKYRHQAKDGAIFELGSETAQQLFNQMKQHKGSFKVTELLPISQLINNRNQPYTSNDNQLVAQQLLSQQADSQYLLSGEIEDISLAKPTSKWLGLVTNSPQRQFMASFTLFDGLSGEVVWNKKYSAQATWDFDKTEHVDTSSQKFWKSQYGATINNELTKVIRDINTKLQCASVKGSVIKVDSDFLTINLGKRHGLKEGDKLSIYHVTTFTDNRGIVRQSTIINPAQFIVRSLYQNHLEATTESGILYGDIQNDALVILSP
jgi:hypothetical protein